MPYVDPERRRERARARYAAEPEREREWKRAYRAANPERERERQRAYRTANSERFQERRREWGRTTRHGITRVERDALYAAQGEACAGCRKPFPNDDLEIDHDHSCCPGERSCGRCIRGLLCHRCNSRDVLAGAAWVA